MLADGSPTGRALACPPRAVGVLFAMTPRALRPRRRQWRPEPSSVYGTRRVDAGHSNCTQDKPWALCFCSRDCESGSFLSEGSLVVRNHVVACIGAPSEGLRVPTPLTLLEPHLAAIVQGASVWPTNAGPRNAARCDSTKSIDAFGAVCITRENAPREVAFGAFNSLKNKSGSFSRPCHGETRCRFDQSMGGYPAG